MRKAIVVCGLLAIVSVAQAAPMVVFQDDFESYTSTAQMLAPGAWGDRPDTNAPTATWTPAPYGNPGACATSSGGRAMVHKFATTPVITDAEPLMFEYDYYDYNNGTADRNTLGIRNQTNTAANGIFEIGEYNAMDPDPTLPDDTSQPNVQGYGFRTVYVGGPVQGAPRQGWIKICDKPVLATDPIANPMWTHFRMTVGETFAKAEAWVDLKNINGPTQYYSVNVVLTLGAGKVYDVVRWGGPSDVSSTGTAHCDNVNVEILPEPATLAMLALGSLAVLRRRGF